MSRDIPEFDWKVFRELRMRALERFCERVLIEIERLSSDSSKTFHDRYIDSYRFIEQQDRDLGRAFDTPRRSQAILQLALIASHGLLKAEELERLTPSTRDAITLLAARMAAFPQRDHTHHYHDPHRRLSDHPGADRKSQV